MTVSLVGLMSVYCWIIFMIMIFGKVWTACFSMLHYVHETGSTAFVLKNVDAVERARPKIFRRLAWICQFCVCKRSTFKHSLLHLKAMFCATKGGLLRSEKPPFGHRAAPPRLSWSDCVFIKERLYYNHVTVERFFNTLFFTNKGLFC